jgi:glycosyltransferase involved in cell wall biosynthesis
MILCVLFKRGNYQVAYVEVYSGLAFLWAELIVNLLHTLKKPCVLALHGGKLIEFAETNRKRIRRLFSKASQIATPSQFLKEYFSVTYPRIVYIPNGIDIQAYKFRKRTNPKPHLIWIRAFHSIYQPLMAVQVLQKVKLAFPDVHLTMIGADKKDGSLQGVINFMQQHELRDAVSIVGHVPKADIPLWLDTADIFLNTTRYESFGVSVLEAACVGLPIVTTNVGELPYLWQNEQEALLVSFDDINQMSNAVIQVLNNTNLAGALSVNAYQKATQFDWSAIIHRWEKLFLELGS